MRHLPTIAACVATMTMAATAQVFELTVDPAQSDLANTLDSTIYTSGTLIGDYDADTNPDGTRTVPGLFGGSGNNPIPVNIDLAMSGDNQTQPTGGLTLLVDLDAQTILITGLTMDMLGDSEPNYPLTMTFLYDTFRTFNPDSLYLGGIPLEIPLGEAVVSAMDLTQTTEAIGTITPDDQGGWTFTAAGGGELTMAMSFLDQPFEPDPMPVPMVLSGTLEIGDASATLTMALEAVDVDETFEGPYPGPQDMPLDLPTLLPPGETAHLLLTLDIDSVDVLASSAGQIVATGPVVCAADFNGDGEVNSQDFIAFLNAFVAGDPSADFNGDGIVNSQDFIMFLNAFVAGC